MGGQVDKSTAVGIDSANIILLQQPGPKRSPDHSPLLLPERICCLYCCAALDFRYFNGVSDTFDLKSRLFLYFGSFVGIEASLADLVDQVGICSIVHKLNSDTALTFFAWHTIRAFD